MVFQCSLLPSGDLHFLFVGEGCRALYGVSAQEIIAVPSLIANAVHPDDRAVFTRSLFEAIQHLSHWHWEGRIVTDHQPLKWVQVSGQPERQANGGVVCDGLISDVSMRRRAQEALHQTACDYRGFFENALDGIFQTTPGGQYLRANAALARIYGYETPDELTQSLKDIRRQLYVDPERRQEFLRLMQEQGAVANFEAQIRRCDGTLIWIAEHARGVHDDAGRLLYFEGTVQDITERRRSEEALRRAEASFRSIFEHAVEGIYRGTADGRLITANPALARMLGFDTPEALLTTLETTNQNYVDPARQFEFARQIGEQDSVIGFEYQVYGKNGTVLWLSENARAVRDVSGRLLYYEGTIQDITERKNLEAERERLLAEAIERADHDPLTGLLNHRAFHKRLSEEAAHADQAGTSLAVAVMDLDNFKFFNDSYGHAAGDDVLRRVAESLRGGCRHSDVLARFGGDEFAMLMPGTTTQTATDLAARLKAALEAAGYRPTGSETSIPLTLSVGVALYPEEGQEHHQVLEIADGRLRHTKTGGGEEGAAEALRALMVDAVQGFSMLDALVTAVDNKDRYTRRHSEDVLRHAVQIGQELGLDTRTLRTLQVAALLHDVGKIGVPDRILRKPSRLTDDEIEAIRQHPMMGAVIVGAVAGFEDTLDAIRHHHEQWDGHGYPFGLAGETTPLLARIMAVADAFSAMTMDRPYRKGKYREEAWAVLAAGAGTQWDPECVAAFERASKSGSGRGSLSRIPVAA